MTDIKAFQLYFAIRLHFTSEFDVFKYGINFRKRNSVAERKDFKLIHSIMKIVDTERQLIELCVANNLYGNTEFLYDSEYAEENYRHWSKVKESLDYVLERDLGTINMSLLQNDWSLDNYLEMKVISDLLSSKIEYESLILLDHMTGCIDRIQGFDSSKYKVRMHKTSKFVNKGVLGHNHISHIDSFLATLKGKENGNIIV